MGVSHREIIFDLVVNERLRLPLEGEQGFVNDQGRFLSREDAAIEALSCGQIQKLNYCTNRLFSEDLVNAGSFNYKVLKVDSAPHNHLSTE